MGIGDIVIHKLTKEKFLIEAAICTQYLYHPDLFICKSCIYEKFQFRPDELEVYVEPEKESKDTNG